MPKVDFIQVFFSVDLPTVISRIAVANSIPFIRFYFGGISIHCKNVCVCVCVVRPKSNSASDNGDDDDDNNNH